MILIVSCCNSLPGLLIVNTETGRIDPINDIDCRGVVWYNDDIYFLTKEGLHHKTPGNKARLICAIANDWHGLIHHDDRLWGVDPVSDTIVEWDMQGKFIQRWHWKPIGDHGRRLHTNDIQVDPHGRLWQCCFHEGICLEGKPQGYGMHKTPHSLAFLPLGTSPLWCASNQGSVMLGERVLNTWPESFTRGLAVLDDCIAVGLSANRNGSGGAKGQIKLIDSDGKGLHSIDLPTNEVYAIARVRGT